MERGKEKQREVEMEEDRRGGETRRREREAKVRGGGG